MQSKPVDVEKVLVYRKGVTLIEVLIAMGILTIGLLSVASLFVVGASYMRQGEIQDRASIVAEEVFHDIVARGLLNPDKWIMYNPDEGKFNRSVTKTIREMYINDQRNQIEEVVGSVFVLDPVVVGSVTFDEGVVK